MRPPRIGGRAGRLALLFVLLLPRPLLAQAPFDLDAALAAVVQIDSEVPSDARTAQSLGTERQGSGVVIDSDGLILTIGYLILEAMAVSATTATGETVPCTVIAYDYDSGFGLVRAQRPLALTPLRLGTSRALQERQPVLVAASGGREHVVGAFVVSRREFAGYWEYLLDEAIFTSPPHPNWGGAALIGPDGRLLGIGSLMVPDARPEPGSLPGNMFVPIDLLKPILADLLSAGRASGPVRPWLGLFATEHLGRVVVTRVAPGGPAARAGLRTGDVLVSVTGAPVRDLADFYRKLWSTGAAGVEVPLQVLRDSQAVDVTVASGDRYDYLKLRGSY